MKTRLLACAGIATLLLIGSAVGGAIVAARRAEASRNSSGSYTLYSPGNPAVTNQLISTSLWNNTFGDIATELSDSLSRSGKGGMTAPLRTADGVVGTPSWSWTSETGTGYYRIGAGDLGLSILGTKTGEWTANGLRVANGAVATPSLSFFNDTGGGLYRIGSNDFGFAVNGILRTEWNANGFGIGGASPHANTPFYVTGSGPSFAIESRSGVNTRLGGNTYFDTLDRYNATGFAGLLEIPGLTTADFGFYTAPSGTAAAAVTFTKRMGINESGVTIGASGTAMTKVLIGSASWTPGSINAAAQTSTNITTTGSTSSCSCFVTPPAWNVNLILVATAGTDVCAASLGNPTAGALTGNAGTYRAVVICP